MFYVYYLLDPQSSELLYVGRSHKPHQRKDSFNRKYGLAATLGFSQRFASFPDACLAELQAIAKHRPKFNKRVASSPGHFGTSFSLAHRSKISKSLMGRPVSAQTREKLRALFSGRPVSEEERSRLRLIAGNSLGRKRTEQARQNMSLAAHARREKMVQAANIRWSKHKNAATVPNHL